MDPPEMQYRQLGHDQGMRIRQVQLPTSLQRMWRWVLWPEQPGRLAESYSRSADTVHPTGFFTQGAALSAYLEGQESGAHQQFPEWAVCPFGDACLSL